MRKSMRIFNFSFLLLFGLCASVLAAPQVDSLLIELEKANSDNQRVDIYLDLAKEQGLTSLDEAIEWLDLADKIANRENNIDQKKRIIKRKGYLYQLYEQTDSSIVYFRKFNNPQYLTLGIDSAGIYKKFGVYHLLKENSDSALYYFNLSSEVHEHINDTVGLVMLLTNMGKAFYHKGDLVQCNNYYEQAYFLALEMENSEQLAEVQSGYLGTQYMLGKHPDDILNSMQEILNSPSFKNNPDLEASVYTNTATIYLDKFQDLEKAEELYLKALSVYDSTSFNTDPLIYAGLGNVYKEKRKFDQAIRHYHHALDLTENSEIHRRMFIKLTQVYSEIGHMDSTVFYYNVIINQMHKNQVKISEERQLEASKFLEIVKKKSKIAKLESQQKIHVLEQNRSRIVLISVVVIFLFSVALFILLYNRKKREAVLQKAELQLKNKDLVNLSLHINEKNQILKAFEEKIDSDKNQKNTDKSLYADVQDTLKKTLKLDEDWQQFEVYLNDLHEGFYSNLKDKFPSLSKTELRVCSLSKLRYNLKETAQTLSISPDSVKSARYRVKKKMELTAKQDLADYLNGL